jgi:hypothetical protein
LISSFARLGVAARHKFHGDPFARLVRHCVDRMFHGGDTSGGDGVDFGIGILLGLLALPGVFSSLFLADKYGSLFQVLRGDLDFDPYAASLPDEYFFITLSMAVTAAVAVWKWDSLLPDRRDYTNLAPLPIPSHRFFAANLLALLFLAALLSFDVNIASTVLFPLVVCGSHSSFSYFATFFAAHLTCMVLASIFSFLSVLTALGALISILPFHVFQKCSLYIRCAIVAIILAGLSVSSAVPPMIHTLARHSDAPLKLLPSVWFVSLNQSMLGRPNLALSSLGERALTATEVALFLAIGAYALGYRRCFTYSAETIARLPSGEGAIVGRIFNVLNRLVFRSPFERASFRFTMKALARGENQALVLGWFGGLGIVIASQTLFAAVTSPAGPTDRIPSAAVLSVPLTLGYFLILGLCCSFDVPVALRANWLFRLAVAAESEECRPFARKMIFVFLFPALLLCSLPLYAYFWSWKVSLIHTAVVAAMCILFAEFLLTKFRKIPFTCSMPPFKSHSIVAILGYVMGFFVFSASASMAEHWALVEPARFLAFVPLLAGVSLGLRQWRQSLTYLDTRVIFEEPSSSEVETMDLSVHRY